MHPTPPDNTLDTENLVHISGAGYQFSGASLDDIKTDSLCLAVIAVDTSTSMVGEEKNLSDCFNTAISACHKAPNREGILFRVTEFNSTVREIRPFIPPSAAPSLVFKTHGMTALGKATIDALRSMVEYAKHLAQGDYRANGILILLTDGEETMETETVAILNIQNELAAIKTAEVLDSILIIMVGFRPEPHIEAVQKNFASQCGMKYVKLTEATPQRLAKLAQFVSHSVSSQSSQIGTGQAAQIPQLSLD